MRQTLIAYLAGAFVMVPLDIAWLTLGGGPVYRRLLGALLLEKPVMPAAVAFYLLYLAGIVYFAAAPAVERGDWRGAVLRGALLGLIAYGTYDLTNLASLKGWAWQVTLMDMAWGMVVTAIAAGIGATTALGLEK